MSLYYVFANISEDTEVLIILLSTGKVIKHLIFLLLPVMHFKLAGVDQQGPNMENIIKRNQG